MLKYDLLFLPKRLRAAIELQLRDNLILEEIRIRKGKNAYLVLSGENILLNVIIQEREMNDIIAALTKNSLYAFRDTVINGFISLDNGIRVGIVGRASTDSGKIIGIYDISEISIRLPNRIRINLNDIKSVINGGSVIIYSPPGVGKTTLLRSIIKELSSGRQAKRVSVIDTRCELAFDIDDENALVSVLSAYPRKNGIEIAVRSMNAQVIVCDEIGDKEESYAIIDAQGAGVPMIATCHGSSLRDVLSRSALLCLHQHKIFDYYIGIKRGQNNDFIYTVNTWEEADADL